MPRDRDYFFKRVNSKGVVISAGRFWNLMSPEDKKPIRRDLCTLEEAEYKTLSSGKIKRRSESEIFNYLKSIYDEKEIILKTELESRKKRPLKKGLYFSELSQLFFASFENKVNRGQKSSDTLSNHKNAINYYIKHAGDHPVERQYFNEERISQFLYGMENDGCGKRTQWKHCTSVKTVLNWGYKQYNDEGIPFVENRILFDMPKKPKSRPTVYTTQELELLENSILSEYRKKHETIRSKKEKGNLAAKLEFELLGVYLLYKAFFLIKNTGMRIGEVLFLPYEHILLKRKTILIKDVVYSKRIKRNGRYEVTDGKWAPKGNRVSREIDIGGNTQLMEFIEWDFNHKHPDEKFFIGNGKSVLYFSETAIITRKLKSHLIDLDITGVNPFYSLRGWAITSLLAKGYPIPKVQDMVGHEDISTTIGYYNMVENSSSDLVASLGKDNQSTMEKEIRINMQ